MKLLANLSVKLTEQILFTLKKIDHLHGDFIFNNIFFLRFQIKRFPLVTAGSGKQKKDLKIKTSAGLAFSSDRVTSQLLQEMCTIFWHGGIC